MPHKNSNIPADQVFPLYLNGLNGRFLNIPNKKKKREIMLVYGHHSSLERMYGVAADLAQYGSVTMPDLPGFGGMDSLYGIGEEPTVDTLADYLAAFIKMYYKKRRFTLAGFSIGFPMVTRMLQKYPDIAAQVDLPVSVAGFTHHGDFKLPESTQKFYRSIARLFGGPIGSLVARYVLLNGLVLRTVYRYMPNAKHKFAEYDRRTFKKMIAFEVELWHNNDVRTYMRTARWMFEVDLCGTQVDLPLWHISLGEADQYFDNAVALQHFNIIYRRVTVDRANLSSHMPSVIATKEESVGMMPEKTRAMLAKTPKKH